MSAIRSHSLSIGIVGLPNSGKSTIFNALTKCGVPAENYPFCTIDKNVGVVKIPDPRLDQLAQLLNSEKKVPSAMTFVDIAGLVKGAAEGEGLGNKFLSHIREVNMVMYVLRAFESDSITHVYERVDPADDLAIVRSELILKDIETLEKRIETVEDKEKSRKKSDKSDELPVLKKVHENLMKDMPAYAVKLNEDEREILRDVWLLTDKPAMYMLNVRGGVDEPKFEEWKQNLIGHIQDGEEDYIIAVDAKMESDVADLPEAEKNELIEMVENYCGVEDLVKMAYDRLNLLTFYTGNEKEANAWTVQKGATLVEAAAVIHTELAENMVAGEIVEYEDMAKACSWLGAREAGKIRNVSKEYIVKDGDNVHILAH